MARKIPCQYCKQRRRKCERSCETEPCQRCVQMKRKCIPQDLVEKSPSSSDEEYFYEDYEGTGGNSNAELEAMNQQVKELEVELQKLEISLDQQRQLVKKQHEPTWQIQFANGQLRLGSEIKTLEELMLYGQSVIRYLSPFGSTFKTTTIKFERVNPSFIKTAMHIVSKFHLTEERTQAALISQRFYSAGMVHFIQPRSMIPKLVDNYFYCFNDTIPILHEASYREHFKTLKDPMTDPITLALCAATSISTCKHSLFNSHEKRYIGEYFFKHAMDILIEIFDEPDRSLEALLTINLLHMFMMTTLRLMESKKWAGIGAVIASNLLAENPDCKKGNASLPPLLRIKYATIHRNTVLAECVLAIIEFVVDNRRDEPVQDIVKFDILPDESRRIQDLVDMMNHVFYLHTHPASILITTQVRQINLGDGAELNFEEIIRYEELVVDWWHNLPDYLKICKEPFNCTKELVHSTNDLRKLLMACYINTITLTIQACFIQPSPKEGLESVSNVVQDRAIYLAMHAADMTLLLSKKMESLGDLCYLPTRLLIRSIDSIMTLIPVKDPRMADSAKAKLNEYMAELSRSVSPDHQVPPQASPYSVIALSPKASTPSVTEMYKNYPLPGEALMYDIIRTIVSKSVDTNVYTSTSPS